MMNTIEGKTKVTAATYIFITWPQFVNKPHYTLLNRSENVGNSGCINIAGALV